MTPEEYNEIAKNIFEEFKNKDVTFVLLAQVEGKFGKFDHFIAFSDNGPTLSKVGLLEYGKNKILKNMLDEGKNK